MKKLMMPYEKCSRANMMANNFRVYFLSNGMMTFSMKLKFIMMMLSKPMVAPMSTWFQLWLPKEILLQQIPEASAVHSKPITKSIKE